MSSSRKPISAKTRFQVLQRDGYACQTCGARAPNATLHVDHIRAVANGGGNEMDNLRTLCITCNLGKSDDVHTGNVVPMVVPQTADVGGPGAVATTVYRYPELATEPLPKIRGEELSQPIYWIGLQWAVTSYGIECLDGTYCIEASRLWENEGTGLWDWDKHVGSKEWCLNGDFKDAFEFAKIRFAHLRPVRKGARS